MAAFLLLEDASLDKECSIWKYGDNCDKACSCNQLNTETCDSVTGKCACKPGWTGVTCGEDIDECSNVSVCPNNSVCSNINGSYNCKCLKGYFKTGSRECEECDFRNFGDNCLGDCLCNFENTKDCNHTTGECMCNQGWTGDECMVDINECADSTSICEVKPYSMCVNTNGSFTCDCVVGFLDKNNTCEDINECLDENVNNCHQICANIPGSFMCSCSTGFSMENETCLDIDECTENISGCEQNCSNTVGSYICSCDTGFNLSVDGISCEPCDMWSFGLSCASNCTCLPENTDKCDATSGLCLCKTGWNGTKCESDINECENETVCPDNSICNNLDGSFDCICKDGFNETDLGECKDIDECSTSIHRCNQNCTNTQGSYACGCLRGFFLKDDNITCEVCESWSFGINCESKCTCNVSNSVSCDAKTGQCVCNSGWSGVSCSDDINECLNETSCPSNAYCTNYNGTYECTCYSGYYESTDRQCQVCNNDSFGTNCSESCTCKAENTESCHHVNGRCSCKLGWEDENCTSDKDECENDETCLDKPDSTCNNTIGSFTCVCNNGYREQDDVSCQDIDECNENIDACSQNCTNTVGSFDCSCEVGYFLEDDNMTCQECVKWTFGENCQSDCSCNKTNTGNCDFKTGKCSCIMGWNGTNCEDDINECENETACPENSMCYNSIGSYECICNSGYRLSNTGNCDVCTDGTFGYNCSEDCECSQQNTQSCNHVTGNCTCKKGWMGVFCSEDIDECEENVTLCQSKVNSTCENTNGSYNCRCNYGLRDQGNMCTDCDIWEYGEDCQFNCTCNISNSEYCNPVTGDCKCLPEWNGTGCEDDVDECDEEDICPVHSSCENTFGSFECRCNNGYVRTESKLCQECDGRYFGDNCSEECICDFDHTDKCHHVSGNCSCSPGWTGDICSNDVDECHENNTICDMKSNSTCNNTIGSFECSCTDGFRESQNETCSDVDECREGGHDCLQKCVNTIGGYVCECFTGYQGSGNNCTVCSDGTYGTNCSEICPCVVENTVSCHHVNGSCACIIGWEDENCSSDKDECKNDESCKDKPESTCNNTLGSFTCVCNGGYKEQNNTCNDIDECAENDDACSQYCTNTNGSFACDCADGFYLEDDNVTCQECEKWTFGDNCKSSCICNETNTETCDSVTGQCNCLNGWNGTSCGDDINECENETVCPQNSMCYNIDGSFECICNNGFRKMDTLNCEVCPDGTFGYNCSRECECNEQNTESCNHVGGNCTCKKGWTGIVCSEDIDECKENSTLCQSKANSTCENTNGSYSCSCNVGFHEKGNMCTDCDVWKHGQNCQFNCTCNISNTEYCDPVTGVCNCFPEWNGINCENDVNECEKENICPAHSTCENSFGSFECRCDKGYLKTESKMCEVCQNGTFGYNCSRECECNQQNTESCNHVEGNCKCKTGWTDFDCSKDIDECEENSTLCQSKANSTCENTNGSYSCHCNEGLREQGNMCTDCDIWKYGQDCQFNCTCNISNSENCDPVTGVCNCFPEWNGTNCELDINECDEEDICPAHSTCENSFGSFECRCDKGYITTESKMCEDIDECTESPCTQNCTNTVGGFVCSCLDGYQLRQDNVTCNECTDDTYGVDCTERCNCTAKHSADEIQTCDTVTGKCKCKPNWKGDTCDEDVNECDDDDTLCNDDENETCINTAGWYECDCKKGFVKPDGDKCLGDTSTTTVKPDSAILIEAVVVIELDLPAETNLNAAKVYNNIVVNVVVTLRAFFRRFTDVWLDIIIHDIRFGSIIANYSIRYGTDDKDVASHLVTAISELEKGTELVYDGQTVNASSDSYKGMEPCDVLYATVGSCGEGYTCKVEIDVPVCKLLKEQSQVNVALVIGLSAAGIFILIGAAILFVFVRRIRRGLTKKPETHFPAPINKRDDDEASGFYKSFKWQNGKAVDAGTRLPTTRVMLPRFTADIDAFNQPFVMRAKPANSPDDARGNWF
ncbi:fibrillin-2-like [Mercenaria mercenaria]|uniref:fibrillin-2-like n=1 Tax=Mercenaria mercenaria TaxID=6596 RepID=UPI00234ED850|nr:fibrillin-2-like [Mercenaria mercenaria]